jgi:kynureninase
MGGDRLSIDTSKNFAIQLDKVDPLARFKNEFYLQENTYYLDGNSLGLLSKRAEQTLFDTLQDWKEHGIDGWLAGNDPWYYFSEKLASKSAPLIGAQAEEVIVTGSTTANLHQLLATFYQPKGKKVKIMADELTFPSDIYAIKSQLSLKGYHPDAHLITVPSRDSVLLYEEDIIANMKNDVSLIVLPSVLYRSGQLLNIKHLTQEAHKRGILIGFDLAHSIGALPHKLSEWEVDFAFWCNYKYLNGGPGSVGGLYVNKRHFGTKPGLSGWFGSDKEKQFDMDHTMSVAPHAGAYQIGTPHILSSAPLLGSLDIFEEAGITNVREKSLQLTQYLMDLVREKLSDFGVEIKNPPKAEDRGGHVCLAHPEAARICKALKEKKVIPDFRSPNVIRLAPIALYTSYTDVWESIEILYTIMNEKLYGQYENKRNVIA